MAYLEEKSLSRRAASLSIRLRRQRGFTLIELLVTVSVLVAVAVTAIAIVTDAGDEADNSLAVSEIRQVARALQRFQADTGYLPRLGPFSAQEGITTAELSSPAYLGQLIEEPEINNGGTIEPIMEWNPDTGRGWNGPYIETFGEGDVTVGENLTADGSGTPTAGTVLTVAGVADPFEAVPAGVYLQWTEPISGDNVPRRGRPYLLFVDPGAGAQVQGCAVPCLLSMGPDRTYEAGQGDDIVLNITSLGD